MKKQKNILIIDDSSPTRLLLKLSIKHCESDSNILEASDASEALKILEEENIDIVSIDYKIPGINGLELLKIIKEKYPHIKTAILTGYTHELEREQVEELGAAYIEKPINENTAKKIIEGYLT